MRLELTESSTFHIPKLTPLIRQLLTLLCLPLLNPSALHASFPKSVHHLDLSPPPSVLCQSSIQRLTPPCPNRHPPIIFDMEGTHTAGKAPGEIRVVAVIRDLIGMMQNKSSDVCYADQSTFTERFSYLLSSEPESDLHPKAADHTLSSPMLRANGDPDTDIRPNLAPTGDGVRLTRSSGGRGEYHSDADVFA